MNKTSSASIEAIQTAIKALNTKGIKSTQRNVSAESGLSIRTVKTYWVRVQGSTINEDTRVSFDTNRVQVIPNRMQGSSSFERLKRRAVNATAEIIPYKPWLK